MSREIKKFSWFLHLNYYKQSVGVKESYEKRFMWNTALLWDWYK